MTSKKVQSASAEVSDSEAEGQSDLYVDDVEVRRDFLMLLARDQDAISAMSEKGGYDVTPYAIRAIARELVEVSIRQQEILDTLDVVRDEREITAGLVAGVLSGEGDPDEEVEGKIALLAKCTRLQGARILEATGVAPILPGAC